MYLGKAIIFLPNDGDYQYHIIYTNIFIGCLVRCCKKRMKSSQSNHTPATEESNNYYNHTSW